ncbi:hypothetical protein BH09PSE2_BH09PSE2_09160 [soil metagenome]
MEKQVGREKALEGSFYADYKGVREALFEGLRAANPAFPGTPGQLLRLAQKILDRFIFAFYCEDMGDRIGFEAQLIRNYLIAQSTSPFFDRGRYNIWEDFRILFAAMDRGGPFGQSYVRKFNGGLFETDPAIDALRMPNHVFCIPGQGANAASIEAHRNTILHLCGSYNYAARGAATESIGLYTLGRIFEQSITELEVIEAKLENRLSLHSVAKRKLPKRKRDGVYYTPEWVVNRLVEGVIGPWFAAAKVESGWPGEAPATLAQLTTYEARVTSVRVVDPACGSGGFLIGAFRRLLRERREIEGLRAELQPGAAQASDAALTASILDRNLYGVDISGAAVEIAKLALWLHSARADAPLSSLDGAVKCGNSLVGPNFYDGSQHDGFTPRQQEQVNAFDWAEAFAFGGEDAGRFDVVLGNPPYVKLQNLRRVDPEVAEYLMGARGYASARTGNFDLYLPFIEKGLALMRPGGRMGYIAPSLWAVNEYGEGLRRLVRGGRNLHTWVDFKSHQIFDEAITYTALQIFTAEPNEAVRVIPAPGGEEDVAEASAGRPIQALPYDRLPPGDPWLLATGEERALIDRLAATCLRLDDPAVSTDIFQGVKTGADSVYKLSKVRDGKYLCSPEDAEPYEVELEESLMRPILSGTDAKRYIAPLSTTFLLFPYAASSHGVRLLGSQHMSTAFPKAWRYLNTWKEFLERRDNGDLSGPELYRFSRSQSLDRVGSSKLFAAGTVPELRFAFDESGEFFLTGGRVDGILPSERSDAGFILGACNGSVCNYVFRRLGRVKAGGWFEANKQFIAPLPIPRADAAMQAQVGLAARNLQTLHSDLLASVADRLSTLDQDRKSERWLWPELTPLADLEARAPGKLSTRDRRDKALEAADAELEARCAVFAADLARGGPLTARFADGELRLLSGGGPILSRIFLDDGVGELVEAYWRWLLLTGGGRDAKSFEKDLRRPSMDPSTPAARQFIERVNTLGEADAALAQAEIAMNLRLFDLYGLTPEERRLIEGV